MAADNLDVFVVCAAGDIERGGAKAFSLSRIDESSESRPFLIFIVRTGTDDYVGYVNSCPHQGVWLNFGAGEFFSRDRAFLRCGRHGANFEIDTGLCIEGPCEGKSLRPVAVMLLDGDVCVCGINLVEDDGFPQPFEDPDETMDVMIHPD